MPSDRCRRRRRSLSNPPQPRPLPLLELLPSDRRRSVSNPRLPPPYPPGERIPPDRPRRNPPLPSLFPPEERMPSDRRPSRSNPPLPLHFPPEGRMPSDRRSSRSNPPLPLPFPPEERMPSHRRPSPSYLPLPLRRRIPTRAQEDQPAFQQTATPNLGPSPEQYTEQDEQTATPIPGSSQAQYAASAHKLEIAQRLKELSITDACPSSLPHAPSHKKLFDTTKLEESSPSLPQPESHKELFDTTKLEETSPSLPHPESHKELFDTTKLVESSPSLPQPELHKELFDTLKLEEPSLSLPQPGSHKELFDTTKLEESSPSLPQPESCEVPDLLALKLESALSSSSFVCLLVPTGLFIKYFVRLDKAGMFHTYPDCDGPFQSLDEAQNAVDLHHADQRKILCSDGLSDEEMTVRNALYWFHDGTRKHSAEAFTSCTTRCPTRELLKSLLDRHNEDNNLLGDDAYVLKKIVSQKKCSDGKDCVYRSYFHFNVTMETKGADDNNDLYFAEVTTTRGDYEVYVLTCLRVLKTGDNGQCHVCGDDIIHPTDDVYIHGRYNKYRRYRSHCTDDAFGLQLFEELYAVRDEAWLKEEEARVRQMVKEEKEARLRRKVKTTPPSQGRRPSPQRLDAPTNLLPPAPPVVPWREVPVTIPPPPQGRLPLQRRLDAPSTQRSTPDYRALEPHLMTWRSSSGYVPPPRRRWPTPPGGRASMDMDRW